MIDIAKNANINPNHLMGAMAHETGGTFDPSCGTFKSHNLTESDSGGYVGLLQIGKDAAIDIGTTRTQLMNMNQMQQLDYIEKYINLSRFEGKLNTLTDFYLAVLFPVDIGKGNQPNWVVFDASAPITYQSNGQPIKNTSYLRKQAYKANPAFFKENGEYGTDPNGKTYVWEITQNLQVWYDKGSLIEHQQFQSSCQPYPLSPAPVSDLLIIRIVRKWQTNMSTISEFSLEGTDVNGYILEPSGPDSTTSGIDKRIPVGEYKVDWHTTSKNPPYNRAMRLRNNQVPSSRQILVHKGNYPADTEGCLLPGRTKTVNFVGDSGSTIKKIHDVVNLVDITKVKIIISEHYQ